MGKVVSPAEAVQVIPHDSVVAIGGSLIRRHPMGLIHEIIRQEKRGLKLLGWNNAIDMDLLVAGGSVAEIRSAYVGMANFGQAYNFRNAVEAGTIRIFDESETTAIGRFRAGAFGEPFHVSYTPLTADIGYHETMRGEDPFTHEPLAYLKAWRPNVAILHAHYSDEYGNIQLESPRMMDNETDTLIARSADVVIVSVEQVVSAQHIRAHAQNTVLPAFLVDYVVELPFGAHPTSCDRLYDWDTEFFAWYQNLARSQNTQVLVNQIKNQTHSAYLNELGVERLVKLSHGQ